ncbi:MAG TPA: XrtB/PEP-CTERM-associated polysaccharide biosynthesis outer membrane protein EpsL [Ramlibacter sp.]|nr:XrtB/PEP-CTERM-associated polysaccharide biosynthesis outer membrane protein EpsL [Ramlibacter sp.]
MKMPKARSLVSLAALAACCAAQAQLPESVKLRGSVGVERDDNVLRSSTAPQSDTIGVLGAGITFDKEYSLQRIRVVADWARYSHRNLDNLDYSTLNYLAAWNWSLTPRFRGVASAERQQYRDVTDIGTPGLNRVARHTDRTEKIEGIYEIDGAWRAMGALRNQASESSEAVSYDAGPHVRSVLAGVGYDFGAERNIYARVRQGEGDYSNANFSGGDFKERELDFTSHWRLTGKTVADGRIGFFKREHDNQPFRDFDGVAGEAAVTWDVTGKTSLRGGYQRQLTAYGLTTGGGHILTNRIYVQPVWRATEQISVNARWQHDDRNWKGVTGVDSGREDTADYAALGVDWMPTRILTLSTGLRHERRKSNLVGFNYRANIVGLALKVSL